MSYPNFDTGTSVDMFGNFSALDGAGLHPSFSPGPMGTSANLGAQQTDDLARDEQRNQDLQNASESYEKQIVRLLQQVLSLEHDRAQRQDDIMKTILRLLKTVSERQDCTQASMETVGKQMSDIQFRLKSSPRRPEQLSLPSNPQYTQGQGARADPLSLGGHSQSQYAPAGRSDPLSYLGNMPEKELLKDIARLFQQHSNSRPLR